MIIANKASSTKNKILIVDDDPGAIAVIGRALSGMGDLRVATNGAEALRLAREISPDLILLDAEMPEMSGYEACEELKADPQLSHIPVIFITSHSDVDSEVVFLNIGAADFIGKPIQPEVVVARVKAHLRSKSMADDLRRLSATDGLTELANRHRFDELLPREWSRARRGGEALSLLLMDVDHFKLYNDHYGHPEGDVCLRSVAKALQGAMRRPGDLVARYGGEEFAILLPGADREGAEYVGQRVLEAVAALSIEHAASPTARHLSVSVGIGCYDKASNTWVEAGPDSRFGGREPRVCTWRELLLAADKALYTAKRAGRARLSLFDVGQVCSPDAVPDITPFWRDAMV